MGCECAILASEDHKITSHPEDDLTIPGLMILCGALNCKPESLGSLQSCWTALCQDATHSL